MTKLEEYHSIKADAYLFWENIEIAKLLNNRELNTYEEYLQACKKYNSDIYSKKLFNDYLNSSS